MEGKREQCIFKGAFMINHDTHSKPDKDCSGQKIEGSMVHKQVSLQARNKKGVYNFFTRNGKCLLYGKVLLSKRIYLALSAPSSPELPAGLPCPVTILSNNKGPPQNTLSSKHFPFLYRDPSCR